MKKLICICGPTATGKTAWAFDIADNFRSIMISADAMQVYRDMNIGTAKEKPVQPHLLHMIDLIDPGQPWSVGHFCRVSEPLIRQAWNEGKTVLLVGGTGLYFHALLNGLADIPEISPKIRKAIQDNFNNLGITWLQKALQREDPEYWETVDQCNPRRLSRALEVIRYTGQSLIQWQKKTQPFIQPDQVFWLGLYPGREEHHKMLEIRTQRLVCDGWLKEVRKLRTSYGDQAVLKTAAIGYREMMDLADGRITKQEAQERILIQTRQYARRQLTWFRRNHEIKWYHPIGDRELIHRKVQRFMEIA